MDKNIKKPPWINKKIDYREMHAIEKVLSGMKLHTVCCQSRCPNISECYARGTVTFLIMGDTCTRNCSFCSVKNGTPVMPDPEEPLLVLNAVKMLKLKYVVITSVTRDDLDDGGASFFAGVIKCIKNWDSNIRVEALIPDFNGNDRALDKVIASSPDIIGHNIETVPSKYQIRRGADYKRSLHLLRRIKEAAGDIYSKSGLILGLGEEEQEVLEVLMDLRAAGCDFLSLGQYLQPDSKSFPVREYIDPEKFNFYREKAANMSFLHVESGVYVRSSYLADGYLA